MSVQLWGYGDVLLCQLSHDCWRSKLRCSCSRSQHFAHWVMPSALETAISSGIALVTIKTFQGCLAIGDLSPKAAQHSKILEMLVWFYMFGRDYYHYSCDKSRSRASSDTQWQVTDSCCLEVLRQTGSKSVFCCPSDMFLILWGNSVIISRFLTGWQLTTLLDTVEKNNEKHHPFQAQDTWLVGYKYIYICVWMYV